MKRPTITAALVLLMLLTLFGHGDPVQAQVTCTGHARSLGWSYYGTAGHALANCRGSPAHVVLLGRGAESHDGRAYDAQTDGAALGNAPVPKVFGQDALLDGPLSATAMLFWPTDCQPVPGGQFPVDLPPELVLVLG